MIPETVKSGLIFGCFLIVGFIFGWVVGRSGLNSTPESSSTITTRIDTIARAKVINDDTVLRAKIGAKTIIKSAGEKENIKYSIIDTVFISRDSIIVNRGIEIAPKWFEMVYYETRELIKPMPEYIAEPFYLDEWFYLALLMIGTTIMGIIY